MSGDAPLTPGVVEVDDTHYVEASSSFADDRTSVLKQGEMFAVFDRFGDVLAFGKGDQGIYHQGTRFLSRSILLVDGHRPLLLSSTMSEDNALLTVDLANAPQDREHVVEQEVIHILRSKFLWRGVCFERIEVTSYAREPLRLALDYTFGSDFADIFEVRGHTRAERGQAQQAVVEADAVELGYRGLDGVARSTRISFSRQPEQLTPGRAQFALTLEHGAPLVIDVTISCQEDGAPSPSAPPPFEIAAEEAGRERKALASGACRVETSNEQFNDWVNRSLADLEMMVTETEHGPYIYAGVPWFSAPFGRDGLLTALEMLWVNPRVAAGVLRFLAATQADDVDTERDAEPGKILHEARTGEMAATGEIPFDRYYGAVDATPLFVLLAGEYHQVTGDDALIREIWPNIERALTWIDEYGDIDGDGFVEYERRSHHGLVNQGWKDSNDSIFHADGSDVEGPVALCEVQGYVYAARCHAARLARMLGNPDRSEELEAAAQELRERFDESFWCEELGTYALALDGQKQQCRVRSSNAGHCLFTGIALPERAAHTAETLLADDSFTEWGIRTLAARQARYNPMSYHNGSVWPHDNAVIGAGLARYGLKREAARILTGMFDASLFVDLHRLPELFCGFDRGRRAGPTLYPVACSPQSWAAAAPFMLLASSLGLTLDAPQRQVRFESPQLPAYLQEVRLQGLRLGDAELDVTVHRHPTDVSITVTRREGRVGVVVVK